MSNWFESITTRNWFESITTKYRWLESPLTLLVCQYGALDMAIGAPREYRLKVDHDWDARRQAEREEFNKKHGPLPKPSDYELAHAHKRPPIKTIHADAKFGMWTSSSSDSVAISINLDTRRIYQADGWLFREEHQGSGAIGVAIFGLPSLILGLPVILLARTYYRVKEAVVGMDRHSWALYQKLQGQLDPETRLLLWDALKARGQSRRG